jgi:hypothetical protein
MLSTIAQGSARRTRRMVGIGKRRAKYHHDSVAEELVDVAARPFDGLDHHRVIGVRQRHQFFRRKPGRKRGKAREVGEHHRDFAPLPAQPQFGLALGQPVDDAWGEVVAEGVLNPMAAPFLDEEAHEIGEYHRNDRGGDRNRDRKPKAKPQHDGRKSEARGCQGCDPDDCEPRRHREPEQ